MVKQKTEDLVVQQGQGWDQPLRTIESAAEGRHPWGGKALLANSGMTKQGPNADV